MALITADWIPLGKVMFFRKIELYQMEWKDVHLDNSIVAAAPFGGPIALIPDNKKIVKVGVNSKPELTIYSSSGRCLATVKLQQLVAGNIINIGWSCKEDLLLVLEDGSVTVCNIYGQFQRVFTMGQEAKELKVLDCRIFNSYQGTGIAVLTSSYRLYVISNIEDPRIRKMAEIPDLNIPPSSWTILLLGENIHALVAKDAKLYLLDQSGQCQLQTINISEPMEAFIEMAVSFDNKHLALLTDTGNLWIGSSDLQKVNCEYMTESTKRPTQLVWCDNKAIVGYWDSIILVVGLEKNWLNYIMDSFVYLVPELDGLRIIGQTTHELLQRVPGVVADIFRIGSIKPEAYLLEASKQFGSKSHLADDYLRIIRKHLNVAVKRCIEAAGHEYDPKNQKMLLKAASFGKCFLSDSSPEQFVNMCQTLRMLNAVRDYIIGIPLTYTQLEKLTEKVLIDRLMLRRQYCLAIFICQYLRIPKIEGESRILAHWACHKVQQFHIDDDQVARAIATKLENTTGVSYAEIAREAINRGRAQLAIKLLDYEARASEQVPLLMKMKKDELALSKAIDSGDTDLVYTVILHLKEVMIRSDFLMAIRKLPQAFALYFKYCKEQNIEMLQALYRQEDNFQEEGNFLLKESYDKVYLDQRLASLREAHEAYKKAKNEFSAAVTDEQIRLLKYQDRLEKKTGQSFVGLSLQEMMIQMLLKFQNKQVDDIKEEFKVSDKRFWWIKIGVLGQIQEWAELEKFSKSKKSPIGYEPFVAVCAQYNNKFEAQKYLARVPPENKVKCLLKLGHLEEAAEFAVQQRDETSLNLVLARSHGNKNLSEKIMAMKTQLFVRR